MKLTKKQALKISKEYNLGDVKSFKLIKGGLQNTNFKFSTSYGEFVIRFIRKNFKEDYLKLKALEFDVLNYLYDHKFPYSIPKPLVSEKGNLLSSLNERIFFVYPYLYGKHVKKISNIQIKSVARALATYHKIVLKFPLKPSKKGLSNLSWLVKKYDKMKKIKPKNKLDKVMLENVHYFDTILNKINLIRFKGRIIPAHSDFTYHGNILFNGNNVESILDFDNIDWTLINKDVAVSIKSVCLKHDSLDESKFKLFLKEYQKIVPLKKYEINSIKPLILRNYCVIFWWGYEGDMKDGSKRRFILDFTIKRTKALEKSMKFMK